MAPYKALYGRKCQSPLCWYELGKASLLGPDLVRQTTEQIKKIRNKIPTAQSRQKNYVDKKRKLLEFQEEEHVFLKVTPTTRIGRVIKIRKLSPQFIGPFQILKRIDPITYQIALPPTCLTFTMSSMCHNLENTIPILTHIRTPVSTVKRRFDFPCTSSLDCG